MSSFPAIVSAVMTRSQAAARLLRGFTVALALSGAALGAVSLPAHAESNDGREGLLTIYTRTGGILQKQVNDQAYLDVLSHDAMVIPEGGAIMMHNGKWYLVQNHKMPDGSMLLDTMAKK